MMKQTDIFNDESLQNDIQDLVAIEQAMIRKTYPLPNLDKELEKIVGKEKSDAEEPVKHQYPMMRMLMSALMGAAAMLAIVFVWQWVSSSGCDAQPYFRIFNPISQSEKFDPQGEFIRRYVPQLGKLPNKLLHAPWKATALELQMAGVTLGGNYPLPIVSHEQAILLTLSRYAVVKKSLSD